MKVFVEVNAHFDTDGKLMPLSIVWEDGRQFDIDRVNDVRKAASLKSGGSGIRYTCRIMNKEVYLFYEVDRWFVEGNG